MHRDVKPSNILVTEDDFAYLIDFGIARAAGETGLTSTGATIGTWSYMAPERFSTGDIKPSSDIYALACVLYQIPHRSTALPRHHLGADCDGAHDHPAQGLTATNVTVGSVAYAAPEQLRGAPLDGRADQYALACSAFHLLTGAPPFVNSNPAVVIGNHLSSPPPRVITRRPGFTPIDDVLARAMAKEPAQRFPTCRAFAAALSEGATSPNGPNDSTQIRGHQCKRLYFSGFVCRMIASFLHCRQTSSSTGSVPRLDGRGRGYRGKH